MEDLDVEDWIRNEKSKERAIKKILNDIESRQPINYQDEQKKEGSNKKTNLIKSIMDKIIKALNKIKHLALWVFLLCLMSGYAQSNKGLVPQKIRVKIEPSAVTLLHSSLEKSAKSNTLETGFLEINKLNSKYGATSMKRVFPHAGKNENKHIKHGLHLWYEITINDTQASLQKVANEYQGDLNISKSEPIREKTLEKSKIVEVPEVPKVNTALSTDDPYLANQWHYKNDGSIPGSVAGSDINLFEAWEITQGSPNVIVAVVDGGIDVDHVDLSDNVWINEAELNGEEGVDDDFNGFVDDVHGFNFVTSSGQITDHEHGTHVAGTVSAVNNNGKGVAGVAGGSGNNDGTKLISCQVFDNAGGAGNFAAAIVYGADNGAVISQNSWGYQSNGYYEQSVLDAINYFIAEAGSYANSPMKGGVVIFAAGNSNSDRDYYPGYYEPTIAVASIGTDFTKAYYSNYGSWVDVTTVGGDQTGGQKKGVLSTIPGDQYGYQQGTSMAAPHASGIAALIVAKYGGTSFTNEMLKQRLLKSVKDIYPYNSEYIGKLGTGYLDAALALAENDETAPEKISDLAIVGVSQDFAKLSWQVPTDLKDVTPYSYQIYYSKNADFSSKEVIDIANNFREVGTTIEYEINGLDFLTTYYFAVVSIDRWGNTSEVSNIVEATTNSGPDIASDKTTLSINIDVNNNTKGSDFFNILNNDNGTLKWLGEVRQVKATQAKKEIQYPAPGKFKSFNDINVFKSAVNSAEKFASKERAAKWEAEDYKYHSDAVSYLIGDVDSTVTNSSATKFIVNNPEGFNLTKISSYLRLDQEDGPAVLEVYKGNQITKENLLYATDKIIGYGEDNAGYKTHYLEEQLFFENGETFWVVYHVPSGNLFPFGIGPEASPEYSNNCFMSFDLGKTWQPIAGAIESEDFVWMVTASSTTEPLENYITLTPNEGIIASVGEQQVQVDANATNLINGTYKSNIVINSNDEDTPNYRIPLQVNVSGHKPQLSTVNILDFGSVFNGLSSTKEMTLSNEGYGRFKTVSVTSSDPQFTVNTSTYSLNVPALDERPLEITFTPNSVGNKNAIITLTDTNGEVHKFNVFGVSTEPAQISIEKTVYNFDNVQIGDEPTDVIKITNTGQYPLQYGFPNFTKNLSHIENLPENVQRFGYALEKMDYPTGYIFNDITNTGTEITQYFKQNPQNEYLKTALGFDFPFFGELLPEMYLTKRGLLTADTNSTFNSSSSFHGSSMPNGYISAIVKEFAFAQGGTIHYKKEPGKFIVQYTNVRHANDPATASLTFQIVLHDSGDIELIYDEIVGYSSYTTRGFYAAIENREKNDGLIVNSLYDKVYLPHKAQQIVYIHSPGRDLIKSVVASGGIIQPGETAELVMTLDKDKLIEGTFQEYINVLSNDPFNSSQAIEVNIQVTGGGVSKILVNPENVVLGDIFQNDEVTGQVAIKNEGTKEITINDASFKNNQLTLITDPNVLIKPNQTLYLDYSVITSSLTSINDELTITDENNQTYTIQFTGNIIDAPSVEVIETSYTETIEPEQTFTKTFTVKNNGNATLDYTMATTEHLVVTNSDSNSNSEEYSYVTRSTYDTENKPSYQWLLLTEEDKVPFNVANDDLWEVIELPFEFEFYNQKYATLTMGTQGVLFFNEVTDESMSFFTVPGVPFEDEINNLIAPYFAPGGPNTNLPEDQRGRYFKAYEDKVVFEWRGYINIFGTGTEYSMQAILYKNGTIKFQYKENIPGYVRAFQGLIGIENKTGTDGNQIAYYQKYLQDGVAVEILPAKKYTLAANESHEFNLQYSSVGVDAGAYNDALFISSNDPLNKEITVPFNLTVTGTPELVYKPKNMDLGEKIVLPNKKYSEVFKFTNTGKATLEANNLRLKNASDGIIEHLVYNFRFGWVWQVIRPSDNFVIEPGFESKEFRLSLSPTEPNENYSNVILADTNYGSTVELPITAIFKAPPRFTVDTEDIYKMAYNNDVLTHVLSLGNIEGESPLAYKLSLNYNRKIEAGEKQEKSAKGTSTQNIEKALLKNVIAPSNKQTSKATALKSDIVEVLSYENATEAFTSFGFGGQFAFTTATEFIAPATGFELSHVQTWYVPGSWLNSNINVEIRVGNYLENAPVLHKETFNHTIESADSAGGLLTFELNKSLKIFPYEKFYLVITHPLGVSYPQGATQLENPVKDRYKYYNGGFWYDLSDSGIPDAAWIMRAGSNTTSELNWLTHNEEETGSINVGTTKDVTFEFHPSRTIYEKNTVGIVIETNDPVASLTTINATLQINQAPNLVTEDVYYVYESETLALELEVTDKEADAITNVELAEDYPNVEFSYENNVVNFNYTPTFEDEGIHTFVFNTEDANTVTGTSTITVEVLNKNRAPIANQLKTKYINLYGGEAAIVYNETMEDPDGDVLSFTYEIEDTSIVSPFVSDDKLLLKPLAKGITNIIVTGKDTMGASTTSTIEVVVVNAIDSNDELKKAINVHPNPVVDIMNVKMSNPVMEPVVIKVMNGTTGATLKVFQEDKIESDLALPVNDLMPGVYFVQFQTKNAKWVKKIAIE